MDNTGESFSYTYSAKERAEVEQIRKKYLPKEEDTMAQLRKLDRLPAQKAQTRALSLGILGTLIMGLGMSLCMSELGSIFGEGAMTIGIVTGIIGMVMVALAYPVYNRILRRERKRVAPEILRLTEELLK